MGRVKPDWLRGFKELDQVGGEAKSDWLRIRSWKFNWLRIRRVV